MNHIIRFKENYKVEWEGRGNNRVDLEFQSGEVVGCDVEPDGPGHEDFDYPCCEIYLPGGIDLWNVPDSVFEVLVGEQPSVMRQHQSDADALRDFKNGRVPSM